MVEHGVKSGMVGHGMVDNGKLNVDAGSRYESWHGVSRNAGTRNANARTRDVWTGVEN